MCLISGGVLFPVISRSWFRQGRYEHKYRYGWYKYGTVAGRGHRDVWCVGNRVCVDGEQKSNVWID